MTLDTSATMGSMTITLEPEVDTGPDETDAGAYTTVEVILPPPKPGPLTDRDRRKLEWFGR